MYNYHRSQQTLHANYSGVRKQHWRNNDLNKALIMIREHIKTSIQTETGFAPMALHRQRVTDLHQVARKNDKASNNRGGYTRVVMIMRDIKICLYRTTSSINYIYVDSILLEQE